MVCPITQGNHNKLPRLTRMVSSCISVHFIAYVLLVIAKQTWVKRIFHCCVAF